MKKSFIGALILVMSVSGLFAQKPEEILFSVDGEPVSVSEFEYIYEKNNSLNNSKDLYSEENLREYLNLYINFKLKVREARAHGFDTTQKFISEFESYRSQLAQPYLNDRKVTEKLVDEAYERMKWEVRARHLLISIEPDAFPSDTLAAYNKAVEAMQKIKSGQPFEEVAVAYSDDPSVHQNKGDLGYFTALQMVYPFEQACYNTPVNKISGPVKSQFGYHIIEVTDKRPYQGDITAAHILIRTDNEEDAEKKAIAENKINSIYKRLQAGETFEDLAKAESEHSGTATNGGKLRPFNIFFTGLPKALIEEAFKLKTDGAYSKPFQTQFGWHLVQRISIEPLAPKEKLLESIKRSIERDSRAQLSAKAAIARIKKENRFKEWRKNLSAFSNTSDSNLLNGTWQPSSTEKYNKKLFRIAKKNYLQSDFATYLQNTQQANKFKNLEFAVNYYFDKYVEEQVIEFEDNNLENKYIEFRNIVQEYREGILMFDITQNEVWARAMNDSIGLRKFFNENRQNYQWKQRADAIIFSCQNKQVAQQIKDKLMADNANLEALYKEMNTENTNSFSMKQGVYEIGTEPVLDLITWKKGFSELKDYNGKYILLKVNELLPAGPKKLTEVKGIVIAAFQEYLETSWITDLKEKYEVYINEEAVKNLFK